MVFPSGPDGKFVYPGNGIDHFSLKTSFPQKWSLVGRIQCRQCLEVFSFKQAMVEADFSGANEYHHRGAEKELVKILGCFWFGESGNIEMISMIMG